MNQAIKDKIIQAIKEDKKIKEISKNLYMTENQLRFLLKSWGVEIPKRREHKKIPRPERDELLKLYSDMRTVHTVAEHYQVGSNTVIKWMRELKIPSRKMKMADEDKAKYLEEHLNELKNITL